MHVFTVIYANPYKDDKTEIKYYTNDGKLFDDGKHTYTISQMTAMYPVRAHSFKINGERAGFSLVQMRYNEWAYNQKMGIDSTFEVVVIRVLSCGN